MKSYACFAVLFAIRLVYSQASSDAVFSNVTDIVSGVCTAGRSAPFLEAQRHLILPRSWALNTLVSKDKVISKMLTLFRNHSTETLKVIIYSDCLTTRQKENLYKELEDHSAILRHVQWIILNESELASKPSWSSSYPSISCDATFVTWPSLDIFDVSELRYAAVCPSRKKITTASYISRQAPLTLFNTTIRAGCRVRGSTRHCNMPFVLAVREAFELFSVKLEWTQNKRGVGLGVSNYMGFFTGTLGELQNRTFDLYIMHLAQTWERFQMFDYIKTTELQSLTFAFLLPAAAPASAYVRFFSFDSFTMIAASAFFLSTTLILLKMHSYKTLPLLRKATHLTVLLMMLLFSQPLSASVVNVEKKEPLAKTKKRRDTEVSKWRILIGSGLLAVWLLSSVILLTGLKSSLISQLKYPLITEPIDTVKKLETALRSNAISPCVIGGTGAAEHMLSFSEMNQPIYSLISRRIDQNKTGNIVTEPSDCYEKMNRWTHVYINFYTGLKQLVWSGSKDVMISKDVLVTFFGSSVAARGWPYMQSMRRLLSKIVEGGLIMKHTKNLDFLNSSKVGTEQVEYEGSLMESAGSSQVPLGMLHFKIAFCIFGVGNVLAVIVALLEVLFPERPNCRIYPDRRAKRPCQK